MSSAFLTGTSLATYVENVTIIEYYMHGDSRLLIVLDHVITPCFTTAFVDDGGV